MELKNQRSNLVHRRMDIFFFKIYTLHNATDEYTKTFAGVALESKFSVYFESNVSLGFLLHNQSNN